METAGYEERGYLREDYRLFHLTGPIGRQLEWHYHTFHKLVMFLSEGASYGIEGQSYALEAGDLVLVGSGCIHRPEVTPGAPYERVILYLSPEFLRRASRADCDLETCFRQAQREFRVVVRPANRSREFARLLGELEREQKEEGFGSGLLSDALVCQLLIAVTRGLESRSLSYAPASSCDEKVAAILRYLGEHLTQEISIDELAERFFVSKYHMMRRFKEQTGYTIHGYLTGKRLMLARERIASGTPVTQACYACGFGDYSAFARAYKKQFSEPPRAAK